MSEETVAIIGMGMIGGSLGAALRGTGCRVRGYDISPHHAETAGRLHLVDEVCSTAGEAAAGADTVVLAVPVLRSLKLLMQLDHVCAADTVIMDAGSAKRVVLNAMSMLPGAARMVGGHPLAGTQGSGPAAADAQLFKGRMFFLTATPFTTELAKSRAAELAVATGAVPVWVDAAEHDRVLAATSHLPQILASLLASSVVDPGPYAGPAFWEMTRLAGSDSSIWRDILLANADEVVCAGRSYAAALTALLDSIEAEDVAAIEQGFVNGNRARALVETQA